MPDEIIQKEHSIVSAPKIKSTHLAATFMWLTGFLFFIGILALLYFQGTKLYSLVTQDISTLKNEAGDTSKRLNALTQTVDELQKGLVELQGASQKERQALQDDKLAAEHYARLQQLDSLIDQLPLPTMQAVPQKTVESSEHSPWRERTFAILSKFVTVKYIGKDVPPLVGPDAKNYLYQNLHAEVATAMWAVLHHQPEVYQVSMTRMTSWIKRYFANQAPETVTMLQELDALSKVNVVATPVVIENK